MMPALVARLALTFARPKSISFTTPEPDTMMFAGVTSRWTMPSGLPPIVDEVVRVIERVADLDQDLEHVDDRDRAPRRSRTGA